MPKQLYKYLPFAIALLSGVLFISLGITGTAFTHYPGDLIDGRFNNYLLEHAYLYFSGAESSFWNAPFMYPEQNVISYSDNLLGSAPIYAVFRFLGCDRELSFQCWYVMVAALNFASCYALLHYLFKNPYAAAAGAMVFAFSLALHSQMAHAQTFPRFAIPLAFLMALLFFRDLKPSYFFGMIFFVVYQIYCGIYLGFLLMAALGLFVVVSAVYHYKPLLVKLLKWKWVVAMGLALLLNAILLFPLMTPYLERAKEVGFYPYEAISNSLLTPKSYLFSWVGSVCWDVLSRLCVKDFVYYCEYQVFPGAVATLGLIVFACLVLWKQVFKNRLQTLVVGRELKLLLVSAFLCFLFFMRFGEFSLYEVLYSIPGFGSMRALQRIINIELVYYAVGAAFVVHLFLKEQKYALPVFIVLVALITLDNYVKPDFRHRREVAESRLRVNELMTKIEDIGSAKVLSYEPDSIDSSVNDFQLDAMLAAQSLRLRTLNGYSATSPQNYSNYWTLPNEAHRLQWLNAKGFPNDSVFVVK